MIKNSGFTIIETLFVLIILTLLVSIVFVSFRKLNDSKILDTSTLLATSILDEARSLTLSAKNTSQYGVHLEASKIVLFKGSSYSALATDNVVTTLNTQVAIRNIGLNGGGVDVIFDRLTGETSMAGTLELYLKASTTMSNTITVRSTGVIEPGL